MIDDDDVDVHAVGWRELHRLKVLAQVELLEKKIRALKADVDIHSRELRRAEN